jgi:spermidine synthase
MLVIGPGGGKEVLIGLFGDVQKIIGVEVNPDFVQIVKDHKEFDGGIYSDFSNVEIVVEEGRNYVKRS